MERSEPTRPRSKKLPDTSTAHPSSGVVSPAPSPELLSLIERLQEEIAELRSTRGMTADEKTELAGLKKDLAEARRELAAIDAKRKASRETVEPQRVNYGFFSVEHVG